jgi:hypothetical protein
LYEQVKDTPRFKEQFATEEDFVLKMADALELTVNLTDAGDEEMLALRQEALSMAKRNYQPPNAEEVAAQEKELYGEELYRKAQEQLHSPEMQAHRSRHGFNEEKPRNI